MTPRSLRRSIAAIVPLVLLTAPGAAGADAVRAEAAWVSQPAPSRDVTAAYLVLVNDGDRPVRVVGMASPSARVVEMHEMVMEGDMMRMRRVEAIVVPPRGRVRLAPGGLHAMLFGLERKLAAGDRVVLVVRTSGGGTTRVQAVVRAPGQGR